MTGGRLIARADIIIGNYQYHAGDELPDDIPAGLADALISCRTAEHFTEPAEEPEQKTAKARPVTAPAGRTGIAVPSSGPDVDLVGRIPPAEVRGVVKEPSKRPGRKSPK